MVLSFHPCFEADKNIICAGRLPDESDLQAISEARAVVLSQGCTEALYRLVSANCDNIFPNFDARFSYPGKIGQIKLFRLNRISHPKSWVYDSVYDLIGTKESKVHPSKRVFSFPFVFKFDWGGGGRNSFFSENRKNV